MMNARSVKKFEYIKKIKKHIIRQKDKTCSGLLYFEHWWLIIIISNKILIYKKKKINALINR